MISSLLITTHYLNNRLATRLNPNPSLWELKLLRWFFVPMIPFFSCFTLISIIKPVYLSIESVYHNSFTDRRFKSNLGRDWSLLLFAGLLRFLPHSLCRLRFPVDYLVLFNFIWILFNIQLFLFNVSLVFSISNWSSSLMTFVIYKCLKSLLLNSRLSLFW